MVIQLLHKSGQTYFLHSAEQCRAVVKEVCLFIQDVPSPPTVNQLCQCGAIQSPWIVTTFGRRIAMLYRAWFGLYMPPEAPQLLHTLHTEPPPHFQNKLFSLGLRNGLVHWDGRKYIYTTSQKFRHTYLFKGFSLFYYFLHRVMNNNE